MTPKDALASDIFRIYTSLLLGLLILAGAILAWLRWGLHKDVEHAWKAYRGWLVMIPAVLGCLFLGRLATIGLFTLLSLAGFKEYARATGLNRDWLMTGAVYLAIFAVGTLSAIDDPTYGTRGWYGLFIARAGIRCRRADVHSDPAKPSGGSVASAGAGDPGVRLHRLDVRPSVVHGQRHECLRLFVLRAVCGGVERRGGIYVRPAFWPSPAAEQHQPQENVGGCAGALAVSLVLPWIMHFSFPYFGPLPLVLTGVIVGIGGQLGDLSISVIKRDVGVKDMGTVIHGHGGILDRIDSLIYVAPLFFHMAGYFFYMQ